MFKNILSLFKLLINPISSETQKLLKLKWDELPKKLQTNQQIYGTNEEGCGASIGVMPRCDFDCDGCYLGKVANLTPNKPITQIKEQMRHLRKYLGKWGNFQLTDGEVTLLPEESLIDLLKYAKKIELIPMLMTHGENFRKNPALLKRLMEKGGLQEISLHIDITQKGRRDKIWQSPSNELELNNLRTEFAELVRSIRRETGLPLRVATTITVTDSNLNDIPQLMPFFMKNSDVFQLISFLPLASVGRTKESLKGINAKDLWSKIIRGVYKQDFIENEIVDQQWWMSHPDCNRFLTGMVLDSKGEFSYHTLSKNTSQKEDKILSRFFEKFNGITFRADTKLQSFFRLLGMLFRAPILMSISIPSHAINRLYRIGGIRLILSLLVGQENLRRLTVVSHHFMSREELTTELGQERLGLCAFKVSYKNELVSMCEFNALGLRDNFYMEIEELP